MNSLFRLIGIPQHVPFCYLFAIYFLFIERFRVSGVPGVKSKTMKRFLLLSLIMPLLGWAATPEKILPKTLVLKPVDWYSQQAKAWSEETNRDQRNAQSWFNFYAASYFSMDAQAHLDQVVQSMSKAVPNSYELWLVKGWNSGYQLEALPFLEKAYARNPEKPESYGLLQLLSELQLDVAGRESFSKQLLLHSQLSPSLLSYSYNVLMSLEPSSVLITEGESTTSPLFVLQDVMKVRQDVSILNLDLLACGSHRESDRHICALIHVERDSILQVLLKAGGRDLELIVTDRQF